MNNTGFKVKEIYPWLYSIYDPQDVFCYLAVGKQRALLFDTGYGIGSLPSAVSEITDKPLYVVLGHGHIDHANGAYQFEEAWLDEKDFELCRLHTSENFRRTIVKGLKENRVALPDGFDPEAYIKAGTGNLKKLEPGRVFSLGDLNIEVVGMEGHTAGSIGLLAREHKVLLDSDSANPHVWMFLNESLPLSQYIAMLERVAKLDFDTFFVGHSDIPIPKSYFQKFINAASHASVEKSEPYWISPDLIAMFPDLKGFLYREDGVEIVFSEAKL
jgi:glyoxylase-like metal-dependent hydrolase (beta-lactamase superfamily II)